MFNSRTTVAHWLWIHNPFYVISALLMLYAVRTAYANVEIGTINCWGMMGTLVAYTFLLAIVGVVIIRWGHVWDDARSILLVMLLMFLAVSVSADDLFVKMESVRGGAALMCCGFGFSVAILLGVLKASRIRLSAVYLVPLILFLGLFFVAPWWCSPELNPKSSIELDWTLFLFPQVAAVILLTLIPAARMGRKSVENNGTPWAWPLFPWSAFVFIGIAIMLRSYALTMTFSQSGPIWASPDNRIGIEFDTIWRPYFLVPFALAALILIVEGGLASGNRRLVRRGLLFAPGLLLIAWPWSPSDAMYGFLSILTAQLGSPVWLTVCLLAAFYGWMVIRKVAHAELGLVGSMLMFSIAGPNTISVDTLTALRPAPLLLVGLFLGLVGLRRHSSILILAAAGLVTAAVSVLLPETGLAALRMATCYHIMLVTCLLLSVFWTDWLSKWLQTVGSLFLMISAVLTFNGPGTAEIPTGWRIGYVAGLSVVGLVCALACRGPAYWTGVVGTTSVLCYAMALECFRTASSAFGRSATTAFSWSAATLIIAFLISAHKARWLPTFSWPGSSGPDGPSSEIERAASQIRIDASE